MSGTEPHVHGGLNKVSHIHGAINDPAQVTDDPKRECTPKMKWALLCSLGPIVVSGCVAGVLALIKEHAPIIEEPKIEEPSKVAPAIPEPTKIEDPTVEELAAVAEPTIAEGVHSGLHKWTCGETTFDLLIDGESVKLGPKIFTEREIALLKVLNGDSNVSTYTIFSNIDA